MVPEIDSGDTGLAPGINPEKMTLLEREKARTKTWFPGRLRRLAEGMGMVQDNAIIANLAKASGLPEDRIALFLSGSDEPGISELSLLAISLEELPRDLIRE